MSLELDSNNVPFIRLGKYKIKVEPEEPNEDLQKKALEELRESPETKETCLRELRMLLAAETDLYVPLESDEYLIKFLRPCKFYPESTLGLIKRFYNFKKKNPIYCEDLFPSRKQHAFSQSLIGFQETRDGNGRRIMTIEAGAKWKPNECTIADIFASVQIALEAAVIEPKTQINGVVVIFNLQGFSLTHAMQITPSFAKMIVEWIQDCIPIRIKGIHIVNQPYIFNMVYTLFKPFLREKIKKRLHFHGSNYDSLKKFIPENALKSEYKGTMDMPELPGKLLHELLCKYEDKFILADSFGYNKQKNNN